MSEYSITIKVDGKDNSSSLTKQESSTESEELAQGGSGGLAIKDLKKAVAATGAVAMGTKTVNHVTSRVYVETGNRQLQDNINATKQVASQVMYLIGGFIEGGPIGGLAVGVGILTDYALQMSDYSYSKSMEQSVLAIQRERMGVAGMSISRSRAQNQ